MSSYPAKTIEKKGKTVEEALALALEELGVVEDEVTYTVIEEPSKGFLGIGTKDAVIRVEVKDSISGSAKKFLSDIFSAMNMEVGIDVKHDDDAINIDLSGDNMGIIIGKRGDTLDSLQYLTSLVANKNRDKYAYTRVTIDTEGYREKRVESLKALSERLAAKVGRSGKRYTLEPMNPYERRIIHANLQDNEYVTTFSIGDEPYRKVVIAPKNEKKKTYQRKPRRTYDEKPANEKYTVHDGYAEDDDLPRTYPGGGKPVDKPKASSFEEYLAEHQND